MYKISGRKIASKWAKTNVLLADELVAKHIPETRKFTSTNLEEMLKKYNMVIIKPKIGSGGSGIIKIAKKEDHGYTATYFHQSKDISDWESLLEYVDKKRKKKNYLIQRGIELATIKGRPIDYRVKIQKPNKKWLITGMVGRLARKGYFITNLCKGGKRLTFTQGVKGSLKEVDSKKIRKEMRSLALLCTKLLEKKYPGVRKLGYDFGIDREGHIWLFEVNTDPA